MAFRSRDLVTRECLDFGRVQCFVNLGCLFVVLVLVDVCIFVIGLSWWA
jgi:hypothetical protein